MAEDDHALVVGINNYQHLEDLAGPVNDADAFEKWLLSPTGGAVPAAHIKKLVSNNDGAGHPSTADIDARFFQLQSGLQNPVPIRTGRRLYVFLAGHGYAPDIGETALLTADAASWALGFRIPARAYADWFRRAALFEEIVVFMDCCRDDYGYGPLRDPPWNLVSRPNGVRLHTAMATKWARKAREGRNQNGLVQGLFTRALLAGLNAGRMSSTELKNYIHNYLPKLVAPGNYQEPEIDDRDQLVFSEAARRPQIPVKVAFAARRSEQVEILDGEFELVATHDPAAGSWQRELEIGQYVVRVPGTNDRKRFEVIGEQVDVQF